METVDYTPYAWKGYCRNFSENMYQPGRSQGKDSTQLEWLKWRFH